MSTIGRIFIVVNLILAGAFVGFAGSFLQSHTDYKDRFEKAEAAADGAKQAADKALEAKENEVRKKDTELRSATNNVAKVETENKGLRDANGRLETQLADLSGDVKNLSSQTTNMAQEIKQSREQSQQAYSLAMEASAEKSVALDEKEEAVTILSEASSRISDLEARLADANGRISTLQQSLTEQETLLAMVNRTMPGALATLQPDLKGVVHQVDPANTLLTVRITDNPGSVSVKPGYRFAIYKGDYKGEAVIQSVEGEFAFCKMTKPVPGEVVSIGDDAATNLGQ